MSIERPYVITRHGLTLDARVLDWDLPIPAAALAGATSTADAVIAEKADIVLTGADTLWPLPPRWRPVPGTPAAVDSDQPAETLYADHLLPFAEGARRYAITDSRARLPQQFFDHNLGDGSEPAWPGGPTRPPDEPPLAPVMLVARATPSTYLAYLRSRGVGYLVRGERRVDLVGALRGIAEHLGVRRVLADDGSQLPTALLRAGLVDEIVLHYFPVIMGRPGMTVFQVPAGDGLDEPAVLAPVRIEPQPGGGVIARYRVACDPSP